MAKQKVSFTCSVCGRQEAKWAGRCPDCGEWNTFSECLSEVKKKSGPARSKTGSIPLNKIDPEDGQRFSSGIRELDRVLGNGIMQGSAVLVGGEPGIGKSTLLLQACSGFEGKAMYVSGEESSGQIKLRSDRLELKGNPEILCETDLDNILLILASVKPKLLIIDSIQTVVSRELGSVAAGPNQLRYCCDSLINWARQNRAALILIAHVTKEGAIAGPKMIEHMVDTVLYFDESTTDIRFLRSTKNRFGSVDEIGLFTMTGKGLLQVSDPSRLFLSPQRKVMPAGIAIAAIFEGTRTLLIELQALTVPAKGGLSRTFSDRIDPRRAGRIAAVLEKHLDLRFSDQDVYINVAGGLRLKDTGMDLPLAMALYSARTGIPLPQGLVLTGEVSLAGEVLPVLRMAARKKTAGDMGFKQFVGPKDKEAGADHACVTNLKDCVKRVFGK